MTMTNPANVEVDVAILGAGTAGMAAYRAVTRAGKRAVLIERGPYGTTCARVGCMPSKLLIAAAEAAHHAREAKPFGVHAAITVDGRAVMSRVRQERDRFVGFVLQSVEEFPERDRLRGHARFVSETELDVDGTRVRAKAFVIATGSDAVFPAMFEPIRDRAVINDHVFDWEMLPSSAVVFGAGVIGLELGQALQRLGTRVRVFGRGNTVGPLVDPVVKAAAIEIFQRELAIDFDAKVLAVEPEPGGSGVLVRFVDRDGSERSERFATALIAAGRRPNVTGLALERAGIDLASKIDRATLRWGTSHVFVAGDAANDIPLLHEAADEGTIAGTNAARFPEATPGSRRTGLAIAFTDPGLATIAGGFAAVSGRPHEVGMIDFSGQGRSRIMLQNRGIGRLYADPETRRFLGAELAGPRAEHLAHLLAWSHQAGLTVDQMLAMPFYHPVVEEGLRTALRDVIARLDAKKL